ncbi:MAG: LamG-like jellyroll fold domain-containing protein [Prevotella sp.]|nr:LamG-like jellyroll fold domain-containing protein [Prevotella sp.]
MKKLFLTFIVLCLSCASAWAQVDNYCIRLSNGGSVDCGAMPELDGQSAYTIQFWMKTGTWKDNAVILSRGDGFKIQTTTTNTIQIVAGGNSLAATNSGLAPGKWTQLTFIYAKNAMKILINGRQAKSANGNFTLAEDDASFIIGGGFDGCIDELRVWKTAVNGEFNYFINNTINKFVPQLNNLVAYFKFDQEQCPNIVDYKALFKPSEYNHHGIISGNVVREIVTDNAGLPYLLNGAYTDNKRFFDCGLTRDQFLLSNDVIMIGADIFRDGHVEPITPNDHATLSNAHRLEEYQGREGVLSVTGTSSSRLICPPTVIRERGTYTFETWIYLEEWTEGAYIFRRESADKKKGFSISLGQEDTKEVIVRVNGKKFVNIGSMSVGKWVHFAVTTINGTSPTRAFLFTYNGVTKWADGSLSDDSSNTTPSGMGSLSAYLGEGLNAKFDNTVFWTVSFTASELRSHMTEIPFMPGLGKKVDGGNVAKAIAYYTYDIAKKPGHDSFSQDEWRRIVEEAYKGYRGYQIRLSLIGYSASAVGWDWKEVIANDANRKRIAADLVKCAEEFDGIEFDLEWMDGTQTNLALLADEVLKLLPKGKTLMISHHQYGAYQYPKNKISTVDGFTFQQYGPQAGWYSYNSFVNGYNAFRNYGYPNNKIYLSYATITSSGSNDNGSWGRDVIGINWGILPSNYTPPTDGRAETNKWNGYNFTFMGPYQVYMRAKFCVDNNLQGIFYWDMGNDYKPNQKWSYAKYCNYGLSSNVDTLVTEVDIKHITTSIEHVNSDASQEVEIRYNASEQTFSTANISDNEVALMELFTSTGVKIRESKAATVSANSLPAGVYLARVRLKNGQQVSRSIIKK